MIGSAHLCLQNGVTPAYICVGITAAVYRYLQEAEGMEQSLNNAAKILVALDGESGLSKLILAMYQQLLESKSLSDICRPANVVKASSLSRII